MSVYHEALYEMTHKSLDDFAVIRQMELRWMSVVSLLDQMSVKRLSDVEWVPVSPRYPHNHYDCLSLGDLSFAGTRRPLKVYLDGSQLFQTGTQALLNQRGLFIHLRDKTLVQIQQKAEVETGLIFLPKKNKKDKEGKNKLIYLQLVNKAFGREEPQLEISGYTSTSPRVMVAKHGLNPEYIFFQLGKLIIDWDIQRQLRASESKKEADEIRLVNQVYEATRESIFK